MADKSKKNLKKQPKKSLKERRALKREKRSEQKKS